MKTFKEFIAEAKSPKPDAEETISRNWQRKHKGMTLTLGKKGENNIHVTDVWLPPEKRGKGIASRVFKGLRKRADMTGKNITLRAAPEKGKEQDLDRFYRRQEFQQVPGTSRYIRHPNVKEAWIPPSKKALRGGTESPLSVARKKGTTDVNTVSSSVKKYADPINNPGSDYEFAKDENGRVTVKSKNHPISVSYSPGDKPDTFVQKSEKTGKTNNPVGTGKEMQRIKHAVASTARPGTTIVSSPVGRRRGSLNTRTGMGQTNEKGIQAGVVRNRSPRQLQKGAKPMDPVTYRDNVIDR
jgi:predicted GNAT family acetyltransferase